MKFTPKSEEELAAFPVWDDGEYSFEILSSVKFGSKEYKTCDRQDKNQNDMLQLVVNVFNDNDEKKAIVDYLSTGSRIGEMKLRHAAVACGLLPQYLSGELNAEDFIGKAGKVKLYTQKGKAKDDGSGFWPDKNAIGDYVIDDEDQSQDQAPIAASNGKLVDDSIPF